MTAPETGGYWGTILDNPQALKKVTQPENDLITRLFDCDDSEGVLQFDRAHPIN
jgi:hypothetical protein